MKFGKPAYCSHSSIARLERFSCLIYSYASAFQLREDILKTKDIILTSSLSRKAKESSSPYFNNFVAIASFLMQDPRVTEGEESRGKGNRVAPALMDQPRLGKVKVSVDK